MNKIYPSFEALNANTSWARTNHMSLFHNFVFGKDGACSQEVHLLKKLFLILCAQTEFLTYSADSKLCTYMSLKTHMVLMHLVRFISMLSKCIGANYVKRSIIWFFFRTMIVVHIYAIYAIKRTLIRGNSYALISSGVNQRANSFCA